MGEIVITSDIIWAIISLVLLYGLQEVLLERKSNHYEKEFVKRRLTLLEQNYEQINSSYKENAKLYHDMNHHFNALYYLLENDELEQAKKYLEEIMTPINVKKVSFRTGIDMLDVILHEMERKAEEQNIQLDISVKSLIRKFQNKVKGRCLEKSYEFYFILEFPGQGGKESISQGFIAFTVTKVSATGSHRSSQYTGTLIPMPGGINLYVLALG